METSLQDIFNFSFHAKAEFKIGLLFIQNISKFLTKLPPGRISLVQNNCLLPVS